ncbi:tail fiber assembly protein [Citrobacter freundii]|uniref:tail fiber assembly protein n=1 Tax=Enterobacteriaceae TaxID=543 RepID=UPI000C6D45AC|nr:tail fiber assembly protein [Escherichia coli]PKR60629.1 phage tail protein [Escherichia coli]WGZ96901.1 tail fiber assembly protein [Klebsiella michiganensis]WGZ97133.1 tail fiber assembly protein [Klebsiella michiganensis]WGZ99831.1 tail fiber assembly protein [Klebsiella michiganensis]
MTIFVSKTKPGFWVESNKPDDAREITDELWQSLLNENWTNGKEIDFSIYPPVSVVPPEPVYTKGDYIRMAESRRDSLRVKADSAIAPLKDAVDLSIATEAETSLYNEWRKYRVLLNRVDTSTAPDINWPTEPEEQAS